MADTPALRTYEIEGADGSGTIRIDIPETWKVTFGPVVGADKTSIGRTMAFRAWETETKQRLLLTNVASFRDISIPVRIKAVRKFGQKTWHTDDGGWVDGYAELVERQWLPIDEIDPRPLKRSSDLSTADEELNPGPKRVMRSR